MHWLVFDAEALNHVDATGVRTLTELIESLREESITFVFARLHGHMNDHLQAAGVVDLVGEEHLYPTVRAAVQAAQARLEPREVGEGVDPFEATRGVAFCSMPQPSQGVSNPG